MATENQIQISGMSCRLYLPPGYSGGTKRYPVIYVNGEIPVSEIMTILVNKKITPDFILLSIKPENWNDDFTPWEAPAFRKGEEPPHGRADIYLSCLTEGIKPYIDACYRTKPEPKHTALFGYSLGGLTAVYAAYRTDVFGVIGSLSGSLWFDGFCEFMEREKPLRRDIKVYLSLGKKESRSKNPRMGQVAACTKRAAEILRGQLEGADSSAGGLEKEQKNAVYFEWNEGGHFHDVEGRFAKAAAWLCQIL